MEVTGWLWTVTLVGLGALVLLDLVLVSRRPHEPSLRECTLWVTGYVVLAMLFALFLWWHFDGAAAGQYVAGWLTEYSLSVDNLFVFVIIMSRFRIERRHQQKVLLVGIILSLLLRGAFIALGTAAISRFTWVFYIFGGFLVYTAVKVFGYEQEPEYSENLLVRWARRVLPMTGQYDAGRLLTRDARGRRRFTPLIVVFIAIGTTDVIFALDSLPAIFGLTDHPYLIFTATVFAMMGLRQLYFLLGGLLDRLVYLSIGLGVVLGFIGVKLILQALAENNLPFLNGGRPIGWAPHIGIGFSLSVIAGTLALTAIASVVRAWLDDRAEVTHRR
ncbi:tellurium resistance protein TerC [Actinoplanes cyaneus]|uniref:Tellurium resistance protein TerC n=1 Tax=Actinoplanes cyaneus TaxID=52696 RepID=A0A919IME5_9ACTN|nr:TerC/Alx family metal homeostasis membrane protein [Actinoplanes cyaneus]MCW2143157.1 tellurite resistance protein TerC [Actinoplanes cyaneus]GID66992.1 tellurium resistance protein TerC [Actinoplanes cyaneus]